MKKGGGDGYAETERERIVGVSSVCTCVCSSINLNLRYDPQSPFFNHHPRTWYSNARRMSSRGRSNSGEISTRNTIRDGWWFAPSSDPITSMNAVLTSWNLCNLRGFSSTYLFHATPIFFSFIRNIRKRCLLYIVRDSRLSESHGIARDYRWKSLDLLWKILMYRRK